MSKLTIPANYEKLHWRDRIKVRNEYVRRQDGKCAHCGADLNGPATDEVLDHHINENLFPENFFKYPVHLHHNHDTGMTIGAVHNYCNAVLWQYHNE